MDELKIPKTIKIDLVDLNMKHLPLENYLIHIHIYAIKKNDYFLGPYKSNNEGKIIISQKELLSDIQATQDSGLMDYISILGANPNIEMKGYEKEEIEQCIYTRKNVWKFLLEGEKERWKSIEELIRLYENSKNCLGYNSTVVKSLWNIENGEYEHKMVVKFNE